MCDMLLLQRNEFRGENKMEEKNSFTMQHYEELMNNTYYNPAQGIKMKFSQLAHMGSPAFWGNGAQMVSPGMLGSKVLR